MLLVRPIMVIGIAAMAISTIVRIVLVLVGTGAGSGVKISKMW
jgi:hypothetical protein